MIVWLASNWVLVSVLLAAGGALLLYALGRNAQIVRPGELKVNLPTKRVARFDPNSGELIPLNEPHMSLAVLLFEARSGDDNHKAFAAGISSEVIRHVNTVPDIRVNSTPNAYTFISGQTDIKEVAELFNSRYVLSGSLSCQDDKLEIIAQLDDVESGGQIWSQTYNQPAVSAFDVQRDIARRIVGAVLGEVKLSETLFAEVLPMHQLDVWGLMNKAYYFWLTKFTPEAILEACNYLRQAIEIQPENPNARAVLAMLLAQQMTTRICKDYDLCAEAASELIEKAVSQAPDDVEVLVNAGVTWQNLGERERAQAALRKAISLTPLDLIARGYLALLLSFTAGEEGALEAKEIIEDNFATAPKHPSGPYWNYFLAVAEQRLGNTQTSIELVQQSLAGQPGWVHSYYLLANGLFSQGRAPEAQQILDTAASMSPYLNVSLYADNVIKIVGSSQDSACFLSGFEQAGLL